MMTMNEVREMAEEEIEEELEAAAKAIIKERLKEIRELRECLSRLEKEFGEMLAKPIKTVVDEHRAESRIMEIDMSALEIRRIDVTSLDSSGGYREFIASFRDAGEVTLNMNFTLASYDDRIMPLLIGARND